MVKTLAARLPAIIVALAAALGLAGCNAAKLGYNALPDLAYWWLDGYLDLSGAQAAQVREELRRLQAWHRQHELPAIAELLGRLEPLAAATSVTPQQACGVVTATRARLERVADQAAPAAGAVALTLTPEQLRHLESHYRRKNADWAREWLEGTPEERAQRRLQAATKRAENFYGRLDATQRRLLREHLAQSGFDAQRAFALRQQRQQEMLALLRSLPPSPAAAGQQLRAAAQRTLRPAGSDDAAFQEGWIQEGCRMVAALHATATPEQRQRAVQRLREYRRDAVELAAEASRPAAAPRIGE